MFENYFITEDFGFACYLKAAGEDLREVIMSDKSLNRCGFVFRVDKDSGEIRKYQEMWDNSEEAKWMKRILFSSKILKKELRSFLLNYYKNEEA
jgi:hypothetical protein